MSGIENLVAENGGIISFTGMFVVFSGLVLIAIAIVIFNRFFARDSHKAKVSGEKHVNIYEEMKRQSIATVPEEELVAITVAIEIYKRLYGFELSSTLTFDRSKNVGQPKLKNIYGHRNL
ncbi:MAG: hypothetical protein CR982_03510 [Candidatus Cloacimonadota bacterium]|nr:MAG: hypothetical protein CR982_03510 [Candidatus Cloacimonadota bacterium]PIE78321.1 MAG: hypothetical protein CSA15_08495 [Candidatus Delongbacteria bacterium]